MWGQNTAYGTVQTLKGADDIKVVAEGAAAADALKVAQEYLPDVILLFYEYQEAGSKQPLVLLASVPTCGLSC
jgi:chemotaxis response regulator CheB